MHPGWPLTVGRAAGIDIVTGTATTIPPRITFSWWARMTPVVPLSNSVKDSSSRYVDL